jgi:hypothetical protein
MIPTYTLGEICAPLLYLFLPLDVSRSSLFLVSNCDGKFCAVSVVVLAKKTAANSVAFSGVVWFCKMRDRK